MSKNATVTRFHVNGSESFVEGQVLLGVTNERFEELEKGNLVREATEAEVRKAEKAAAAPENKAAAAAPNKAAPETKTK